MSHKQSEPEKALIHRCSACGTFVEVPGDNNEGGFKPYSLHPLPTHFGLSAGIESGEDMVLAEHLKQANVCDGSEGLERVTPCEFCDECGAPVPEDRPAEQHWWHKESCSLYTPKPK